MLGGATALSGGYRAATLSSSEALLCVNHNGAAFTTGRCMVGSENAAGDKAFLLQLSGGGVQVYSDVAAHGTFLAQGSSFGLSGAAWGRVSIGADLGGGSGTHTYAVSCDGINYQTVYSVSGVPAKFLIGQIVASLNVAYALEIRT